MLEKEDLQPSRFPKPRNPYVVFLLILFAAALWPLAPWVTSQTAFSQTQYDQGYLTAFRLNATGPAYVCFFKNEFWSEGKGFDDGKRDFEEIYPVSYTHLTLPTIYSV